MRVGFTGSRDGLSVKQVFALVAWWDDHHKAATVFRHGCCRGADAQMVKFVHRHRGTSAKPTIFGHPSDLSGMTDNEALSLCDDTAQPESPLERNEDIVNGCDVLIACPKRMEEEQRSGTWATVRYARTQGRRIVLVWPDGTVGEE